jgi:hypothetical protein
VRKRGIECGKYLQGELVFFEEVSKPKNGALIGQVVLAHIERGEFAKHRLVVQRFFQRWVREVELLLEKVDAQHGSDCE